MNILDSLGKKLDLLFYSKFILDSISFPSLSSLYLSDFLITPISKE